MTDMLCNMTDTSHNIMDKVPSTTDKKSPGHSQKSPKIFILGGDSEPMDIATVNRLTYDEFISKFGNVVVPACAAAVWRSRPFSDVKHLSKCFADFIEELPMSGKKGILRLCPELPGGLAQTGMLTKESTSEQRSAGLHEMTVHERMKINSLNQQYREKFGFPFVICARQNKKTTILKELERRLNNSPTQESLTGIKEVKKICDLRLNNMIHSNSKL